MAIALIELSPETLICSLTGAKFSWAEVLDVSPIVWGETSGSGRVARSWRQNPGYAWTLFPVA